MKPAVKAHKKLIKAANLIQGAAEDLAGEAYQRLETEQLKMLAISLGVDHTREPTWILEQIGEMAKANGHELTDKVLRAPCEAKRRPRPVRNADYLMGWKQGCEMVDAIMDGYVEEWNRDRPAS